MAKRFLVEKLSQFYEALEKAGLSSDDAATVAEVLVMTDTWGTFSHGTGGLRNYLNSLRAGGMNPRSKPEVVAEGDYLGCGRRTLAEWGCWVAAWP